MAVADQRPAEKLSAELEGHGKVIHYKDAVRMAEESGPEVDVIVETIGGYNVALNVASSALKSGISLVTANKAMLAVHAADLTAAAEKSGAKIGWEAAVGGGIPCIRALREGCAANRISYAAGILNGTCNFILTTVGAPSPRAVIAVDDAAALKPTCMPAHPRLTTTDHHSASRAVPIIPSRLAPSRLTPSRHASRASLLARCLSRHAATADEGHRAHL